MDGGRVGGRTLKLEDYFGWMDLILWLNHVMDDCHFSYITKLH
jgi:hypothetical protein